MGIKSVHCGGTDKLAKMTMGIAIKTVCQNRAGTWKPICCNVKQIFKVMSDGDKWYGEKYGRKKDWEY